MPTFSIENEHLRVAVQEKGAELDSVFHKQHQIEYLWQADPAFWAKKSPVLFPIVGALRNGTYFHNGRSFALSRHGFARDRVFALTEQAADGLLFTLNANADTRAVYPFDFQFGIRYQLTGATLSVAYEIHNTGHETMFFSVGGHPAFRVPLRAGTRYEDYRLHFNEPEPLVRWPLTTDGLIGSESGTQTVATPSESDTVLPLTRELFYQDALVFKHLRSTRVKLASDHTPHGLEMEFGGFPYFGVWATKNADFVCLEPWCGIADATDSEQQLAHKEGIEVLEPGNRWSRKWSVAFW